MSATRLAFGLLALAAILAGCRADDEPDAYGIFEAIEVTVSAEVGGRLVEFRPREGARLAAGDVVGLVDTSGTDLQRRELLSRRRAAQARAREVAAQVDVLLAQLETAGEEYRRFRRLLDDEAATAQQVNIREGEVRTLERRIDAARISRDAAAQEITALNDQIAQIERRLADSRIRNPADGHVLALYARRGEFVQPGAPLYDVAALDTLTLRAYVTGAQLASVQLGGVVSVSYDVDAGALGSRTGVVRHVADRAEFTPTPIQTRDERAEYVYAVEIDVPNPDGALKIGMPAEVTFAPAVENGLPDPTEP